MKEWLGMMIIIIIVGAIVALPILYPNPHFHQFHSPPQPYNYPYTP